MTKISLGAAALLLASCAHAPQPAELTAQLKAKPGSYVAGPLASASVLTSLHKRDFVYDVAVDRSSAMAAFPHLSAKVYRLNLYQGAPDLFSPKLSEVADAEVNVTDFDVEAVAFSPDGTRLAVASHDKQVRLFDTGGKLLATAGTEEELSAVAFSPDGQTVVVGSTHGLLTVLSAADLSFGADLRAHEDAIRGLAFDDKGVLWSGGWDKQVRSFTLGSQVQPISQARLHYGKVGALTSVHAMVNGKAPAVLGVDERALYVTLTPEAAQRAGIDVSFLKDHVEQMTPAGKVELPLAHDQTLLFKALSVPHVEVLICQNCAPPGIDGLLGQAFLATHPLLLDEAHKEVVIRLGDPSQAESRSAAVITPGAHFALPGFVQDLTVSRDGTRLGLALDVAKPERNLALYKREKASEDEPQVEGNLAAIVDAQSGAVLEKHAAHRGVVASAAISPDGRSLASGGWDRWVYLFSEGKQEPLASFHYGWCVRRVRFAPDGRLLAVAAWTPQNAQNADSDPSAQLIRLDYARGEVRQP